MSASDYKVAGRTEVTQGHSLDIEAVEPISPTNTTHDVNKAYLMSEVNRRISVAEKEEVDKGRRVSEVKLAPVNIEDLSRSSGRLNLAFDAIDEV